MTVMISHVKGGFLVKWIYNGTEEEVFTSATDVLAALAKWLKVKNYE